ncbi:hypothetical protein ACFWII_34120 [Streptomyces sp. NPDC127063]|uniref:hypothetical protein n=1 Tax=Streptomyces sp. NPDC127063 TaxID=3347123 RepID=UPI00365EE4F4
MRPLTGQDIVDFYNSRYDLLVIQANEFTHLDESDVQFDAFNHDYATTDDGDEVQILLRRSAIDEQEWFPDSLDGDGKLLPDVADEMADLINSVSIQPPRALAAAELGRQWVEATKEADKIALARAKKVAELVAWCGGNQSHAGRLLGLDQSTVNKLVKKAKAS